MDPVPDDAVSTTLSHIWLDSGVICFRVKPGALYTVDAAREDLDAAANLTQGVPAPAVADIRELAFADYEARELFAAPPEQSGETATALVVQSMASRTVADAWVAVSKPDRPVNVFHTFDEALQWAKGFVSD